MFSDLAWCLAVKAVGPQALPNVDWQPHWLCQQLFGFRQFYYNPCRSGAVREFDTRRFGNIELMAVVANPSGKIVCEVYPELIEAIAILPCSPHEALQRLQNGGWPALLAQATLVHRPNQRPLAAAA